MSLETAFPTGHGRHGKGTEYHAFNLALNTWQLHYLRLTGQLGDENSELRKRVFQRMNEEYTGVMRRFNSRGAASMWDRSKASVWLTAWTLQIFRDVAFQVQIFGENALVDAFFRIGRISSTSTQTSSGTPQCGCLTTSRLTAHLLRFAT